MRWSVVTVSGPCGGGRAVTRRTGEEGGEVGAHHPPDHQEEQVQMGELRRQQRPPGERPRLQREREREQHPKRRADAAALRPHLRSCVSASADATALRVAVAAQPAPPPASSLILPEVLGDGRHAAEDHQARDDGEEVGDELQRYEHRVRREPRPHLLEQARGGIPLLFDLQPLLLQHQAVALVEPRVEVAAAALGLLSVHRVRDEIALEVQPEQPRGHPFVRHREQRDEAEQARDRRHPRRRRAPGHGRAAASHSPRPGGDCAPARDRRPRRNLPAPQLVNSPTRSTLASGPWPRPGLPSLRPPERWQSLSALAAPSATPCLARPAAAMVRVRLSSTRHPRGVCVPRAGTARTRRR